MKKSVVLLTALMIGASLTACSPETSFPSSQASAESLEEAPEPASADDLSQLTALPGMKDEDTAGLFGGGEENWSADRAFFIGRIFHISLYGQPAVLHTTCDQDNVVSSVSVWLADENAPASQEDIDEWVKRINAFTGTEASCDDTASEGGSLVWRWTADKMAFSLYHTGDILSLSIVPAVGELH